MINHIPLRQLITKLFEQWAGEPCEKPLALSANGSNRQYWRLIGNGHRCIAAFNADVRENEAFFHYAQALAERGVKVPEIYSIAPDRQHYLQQDLGDTTLYLWLYDRRRQGRGFDAEALELYRRVLDDLAAMQVAGRNIDFSHAYPRPKFDSQAILWDLQYFKYCFLKPSHIPFDEQLLEDDFITLAKYLLSADCSYFMHRDFQARNIMLVEDQPSQPSALTPYYIDFQGARQGAAQYDVASLLYSAKSDLPEAIRQELLNHYVKRFSELTHTHVDQFTQYFYPYVLIRILQAMGAYGYRGHFERKEYFLSSIPIALGNLRLLLENHPLPIPLPHLTRVLETLANQSDTPLNPLQPQPSGTLTVTVSSFSYKKGLPEDTTGNGGGYLFDCRALPNPGRYPEYRCYTGRDLPVIQFLKGDPEVEAFLADAQNLVGASIRNYQERHFSNLSVGFGCTGGQHRSVYCAERLARWLAENFDCHVVVRHREQEG